MKIRNSDYAVDQLRPNWPLQEWNADPLF